jgi:hypothetical protein
MMEDLLQQPLPGTLDRQVVKLGDRAGRRPAGRTHFSRKVSFSCSLHIFMT